MVSRASSQHNLALRVLILAGLLAFGFYLVAERGLLDSALSSDRSYISYVILLIYVGASGHWLLLAYRLSDERNRLGRVEQGLGSSQPPPLKLVEGGVRWESEDWAGGYLAEYLRAFLSKRDSPVPTDERSVLISALGDEIANRHAAGHFISDTLLKLGLLGTIVGFILMLLPVADMTEFETVAARELLREMSSGMAVALYTTLAGLVTSTLLKLQYQVLDTSAQDFITRLAVVTEVHLVTSSQEAPERAG